MIKKVRFKYRMPNYQYRQKTMLMEIPVDKYGFILPGVLSKTIQKTIETLESAPCVLLWHQII